MDIIQAAPLYGPITEQMTYGSIERVVVQSSEALVNAGHSVAVSALEGTRYGLLHVLESGDHPDAYKAQAQTVAGYAKEIQNPIIHTHNARSLGALMLSDLRGEVFATIHGPAERAGPKYKDFPRHKVGIFALSQFHALSLEPYVPVRAIVPNGVNTDFYVPGNNVHQAEDYSLILGRVAEEKGVKEGIIASNAAGLKAVIAGPIHEPQYFKHEIEPYMLSGSAEYIGCVSDAQKLPLLQSARVLLQLSKFNETCGLSALEAQSCGVPVVAFAAGALPETVKNGKTGFIVKSVHEATEAIERVDALSPEQIRNTVIEEQSWSVTIQKLIAAYQD